MECEHFSYDFVVTQIHRKTRTGGLLISMIRLLYHLTLMLNFHHLQQLAEELHGIFLLISHQAQEVGHGVVGEEDVEGVESKVETVS